MQPGTIEKVVPGNCLISELGDVGIDNGSSVDRKSYMSPFKFSDTLNLATMDFCERPLVAYSVEKLCFRTTRKFAQDFRSREARIAAALSATEALQNESSRANHVPFVTTVRI